MASEDKERRLLVILQDLVKTARKNRGMITGQQLREATEGLELSAEQLQMVKDYLRGNDIGIDEPLEFDDRATEEEKDYLEEYRRAVEAIPQPSSGEMEALKIRAMAGEPEAQRELAECMLPMVLDFARLYTGQGVYAEDLVGAGNEALVRAVRLLAPLDTPEEVDASISERIMNAMEDLVSANLDACAVDQSAADRANEVMDRAQELAELLGRKVTVEELAAEGDVTEEEILNAIRDTGNKIEAIDYKTE